MFIMSRHGNGSLCEPKDTQSLNVGKSNWRLRVVLVSVFIISLFYQVNLILTTFGYGYVLSTNYRILRPCMSFKYYSSTPDCPEVDLTWTGLFPCDLGWKGSALTVVILSTLLFIWYYFVTICLLKWNTQRKLTIYFRKLSVVECCDRYAEFEERVESTNTQMLSPTLSLCLVLMAFHLLLQSGDIESNPGPNHGYETMVSEGEKVVEGISRDPKGWAVTLHCKGFISDTLKDEIIELDEIKTNKAQKLHSALIKVVDQYPRKFDEFISLLQEKGSVYNDLTDLLSEKHRKLKTSQSPTHIQSTEESMEVYRSYLTNVYNTDYLPVDDKYPLSCTKCFVNLECADVSKHCTRNELEKLWSDIVRGKLDKIPRDKIPIQQIALKQEGKFPKLILIKGAPGVGKTTLSWELCRQWANGQFWTEYSFVVLLRLRDESSQTATEVVDLLQCEDNGISRSVESIIRRKQGHGVLFLLEGLDELPETLRKDSIFLKLITGRLLPASTVLVTTRPWAVQDLPRSCSQRIDQFIDILGFSSEQIREYIDLMIKDGAPAELRQYIYSNPSIVSSLCNPLHAKIIVKIYTENYKDTKSVFPNTTTEVYCSYSRVLIERHLQDTPEIDWSGELTDLPSAIQPHFDKLCYIAYKGIASENQQLVFFKEDIQDCSSTLGFMNSVHPLYRSIMTKNTSPSYNFLHLTLQEFLAAFYISKNMTQQEQLILFVTKEYDGSLRMILLFLAGLTGFNDPCAQCAFPNPQFYYQDIGSSRIERIISYRQTLWFYESQNLDFLSRYKKILCNLHLGMEGDYDRYLFALGYLFSSSGASIGKLELMVDLFSPNDQSMLLAGMKKASHLEPLLLRVKHLKIVVDNLILPDYLSLDKMILPEIEQLSLTMVEKNDFMPPGKLYKKSNKKFQSSVEVLYDMIKPFSALKLVDIDFNVSRDIVKKLLIILKAKKCLKTLKYTVVSKNDEELLLDFVKYSSIKTLILKINVNLFGRGWYSLCDTGNTVSLQFFSIGLNVYELRKNNSTLLPTSLLEFPISVEIPPFVNKDYETKRYVECSALKKFISVISHWKLSLISLIYSIDSKKVHLYHPTSNEFYSTIFSCPLLEKVVIGNDRQPAVLHFGYDIPDMSQWAYSCAGLTDGLRVHQNLHTLSLCHSYYLSELFDSLSINNLLKSLKLGCLFNSQFDTEIREYLLINNNLEELELNHMNSEGWSSGLIQGLKHNTCLRKLTVFCNNHSCLNGYGVDKEASILMASMFRFNTTLCFLKCWLPMCIQPQHDLPLILEALGINKALQHLELYPMFFNYELTPEETEALGKMLSTNDTLELFYFTVEITNYQPIIKGLLNNKTLKEFGVNEKTEKNFAKCPNYIHIRNKIRYLRDDYIL